MFVHERGVPGIAQVAADARPVAYEKVQRSDPEEFRHLCDRCATSIADLYRTCPACERTGNGFDLCLQCCTDARTSSPGQVPRVPTELCQTILTPLL